MGKEEEVEEEEKAQGNRPSQGKGEGCKAFKYLCEGKRLVTMACPTPEQRWLDMAILDLQSSKQMEAVALEQASILLEEKKMLEEKLKLQHDLWTLDKQQLEQALIQTKKEHESSSVIQSYQIAALHVSLGSYRQEALMFKLRLEGAVDEVEILSSRLHILNVQLQEKDATFSEAHDKYLQSEAHLKQSLAAGQSFHESHDQASNMHHLNEIKRKHELEMKNLKKEQCVLSLKRKEEVSALLREKTFVWDQLKRMEDDFTSRLNTKRQELKCAEEALQKLELRVDDLQKAHDEKTVEATVIRINMQAAEAELLKLREDLSQLKPTEHVAIILDPTNLVSKSAGLVSAISHHEGQVLKNGEGVLASDDIQALKFLADKEEELKQTRKFMDELRLENQNLRLLYADLEEQLKEKQKPERLFRDNGKDATSRNLNADLEAVAINAIQTSPKVCAEAKRRRLLASESCAQEMALRQEQPTTANKDASNTMELSSQNQKNERKAIDNGEQNFVGVSQESVESRPNTQSSTRATKNRLFSSVFGIPKVVAET
ncbi:hypothetical protein L7F22_061058 [Adiantum nelumboides]|nr:hypothetical protein [Adiantum nelumboides]